LAACGHAEAPAVSVTRTPAPTRADAPSTPPVVTAPQTYTQPATAPTAMSAVVGEESPDTTSVAPGEQVPQGINTDQSIPPHPVTGPTAKWPEGSKHIH
jgi:hypothetical protein